MSALTTLERKLKMSDEISLRAIRHAQDTLNVDRTFSRDNRDVIAVLAEEFSAPSSRRIISLLMNVDAKDRTRLMARSLRMAAEILDNIAADPETPNAMVSEEEFKEGIKAKVSEMFEGTEKGDV